jgi:hypothetical protein
MTQIDAEQFLNRARRRLRPERTRVALLDAPLLVAPADIGALDGYGLQAKDPDVVAAVYVFGSQREHAAAQTKLKSAVPHGDDVRVEASSNGPLLFFGYTRTGGADGTDAKYRLLDLVSAFSGEE